MKKVNARVITMRLRMHWINIGMILSTLLFSTQVSAHDTMSKTSGGSGSVGIDRALNQSEKNSLLNAIEEAMNILREDEGEYESNSAFGVLARRRNKCDPENCEEFIFKNKDIPDSDIWMETRNDPLNLSEDRVSVPPVPYEFVLRFVSSFSGISIDEIKQTIQVEDYWVTTRGEKKASPPDGISLSPTGSVFSYRYRAKETPLSRFPVDVVVTYLGPSRTAPPGSARRLESIYLSRDYPYLTPEMRKKKREEMAR
ncbi:hypothetical protein [Paraburkholderia bannensis]|uniref:hypothetical protein n=1 Tax=Paraburkholderia bannensis TaxID=765414 RepID=UPI002AB751CF|nr:hypothetical protein [Paraburkholderia bannensis]